MFVVCARSNKKASFGKLNFFQLSPSFPQSSPFTKIIALSGKTFRPKTFDMIFTVAELKINPTRVAPRRARKASLPKLSEYGREHPTVPKVSPGTVNKQLGAVQAITGWGRHNGLVPEDAPWSDPFEEMRLDEEQSQRAPFDACDRTRALISAACSPSSFFSSRTRP
jgi:hypothetical protein